MLVSPSNLLPCLNLINDLWRREMQSKNALEIVRRGEELYNKLAGFVETFDKIGSAIVSAQNTFTKAKGQLSDGAGNVFRQAEMLRELGLKTQKRLPGSDGYYLPEDETND
jgi:DNA recombination protein RmuC